MRRKVAVIVDAPAAVPQSVVDKLDIGIVPLHAIVDGRDYLETEVDMDWLLARLRQKGEVPTTSAPSIGEILNAYEWAAERAESAISIHMTSVFSKGYGAALEARKLALEKHPGMQIEVIDSRTAEAGELPITVEAATRAMEGASFEEVVTETYRVRDGICALFCFETLFYRDKGGRVFKAKPWAEAEENSGAGFKADILRIGIPDEFIEHGKVDLLFDSLNMDPESIVETIISRWPQILKQNGAWELLKFGQS